MTNPILDTLDDLQRTGDQTWSARSRAEVMQGRATFGGIPAGWCLRAMDAVAGAERRCRALQLSFTGPVTIDPAEVRVESVRVGRSATHLHARVVQGDEIRLVASAVYGADRPSGLHIDLPPRPDVPAPDDCTVLPYIAGVMPRMTEFVRFAVPGARVPFMGSDTADFSGHVRLPDGSATADAAIVAALVDAWWPPVLPMLDAPAPASSVTWSLEFPTAPTPHTADAWWAFTGGANAASGGYASCHGMLFDPDGTCVAISRQLVAVFDRR